ncbi:hypothetical protein P7L87_25370 [Vibrio parahaemolyticus]|nr:hypothetical protein [Vibrio parahaemolyticus]
MRLALTALPAHEAAAVKRRLDSLRTDCGCGLGAIVMLGATGLWVAHTVVAPVAGRSWLSTVALGLLVVFTSTLIGKLLGIALSRIRFHFAVRSLRRRVPLE